MTQNYESKLRITSETSGGEQVRALADELDRLAAEGGKAAPQLRKTAEELRRMEQPTNRARGLFGRLRGELAHLPGLLRRISGFLGLGGAGLAGGMLALARSAANAADEIGKMRQRVGGTTEELSRLAYATKLNDSNARELEAGLKYLSVQVEAGNENFARLGISLRNNDGTLRSSTEVFVDLAEQVSKMPDGIEKTNLASDLLGRQIGGKLIPTLNQGRDGLKSLADEADRFGETISEEAARRAEEFNDNLVRLQSLAAGVGREIGNTLIPALNALAKEFLNANTAGLSWWEAMVGIGLSSPLKSAEEQIDSINDRLALLARRRDEALRFVGGRAEASVLLPGIDREIERRQKELRYWQLQVKDAEDEASAGERKRAEERVRVETQLGVERVRLAKLVAGDVTAAGEKILRDDKERTKEQIKNAERLRDALNTAWEATREQARAAGAEAKALMEQAGQALRGRQQQAQDRRDRDLSPEEQERRTAQRAEKLTRDASQQATFAQVAATHGRAASAQKYAEKALELSKEAAQQAERVGDNRTAARLLESIGQTEKAALEAQAKLKEEQQAELEAVAKAQLEKIREIEAELEKIKRVEVEVEITEAKARVAALQQQLDGLQDKTVTVTVRTQSEADVWDLVPLPDLPKRAYGGRLPGDRRGDRSDHLLYWGTPGEWVVQNPAVRHYGEDFIRAINEMRLPRFAYGGQLGAGSMAARANVPSAPSSAAPGGPMAASDLVIPGAGRYPIQTAPDVHAAIERALRGAARTVGRRR